ncbi:MAG: S8 family peptidase [Coraliomargaritaceae bacterium]
MKRITILFCIILGLGVLGIIILFNYQRSVEPKIQKQLIGSASSSQLIESFPLSKALSSTPTDLIEDQKSTGLELNGNGMLQRFPRALKPLEILSFDEIGGEFGRRVRRTIVSTNSTLGKVLVLEHIAGNKIMKSEFFSAEHLVVPIAKNTNENEIAASIEQNGFRVTKPFPDSAFVYAHLESETPSSLLKSLELLSNKLKGFASVELDGAGCGGGEPSDPSYSLQWHHQKIGSQDSWDITEGDDSIIVAVLDTGVSLYLTEFNGRITNGYDYANNDSDPSDDHGHGTAVAGVIASNANNGLLVAGVDWKCKLMPVKVLNSNNWGYYSWWAAGVSYAKNNGAHVINLSAGGTGSSSSLTSAINSAISAGVIFVTITQNDGAGSISYPGSLLQAITVGATDDSDIKSSFSNWGPEIDLVAPGRNIYTIDQNGSLVGWLGTSFAAPLVTGTAALLLSINPDLDQDSVADLLVAGAEDQVGDIKDVAGFDNRYGWGRLNTYNSIILAQTSPSITMLPNKDVRLRWRPSQNAESKKPYKLQWSDTLGDWKTINSPSISYGSIAEWIDNGFETGASLESSDKRFYTIRIGME